MRCLFSSFLLCAGNSYKIARSGIIVSSAIPYTIMSSPSTLLWKQIAQSIEVAIADGKLAVGERLPSEVELAAQWRVCRMTAHRAMQELQRRGIVERRRRHGTFVAPASARRAAFHDLSSICLLYTSPSPRDS